jgi:hypothetical protein
MQLECLVVEIMQGKGEVVLVSFLTEHHAMKTCWRSEGIGSRIL